MSPVNIRHRAGAAAVLLVLGLSACSLLGGNSGDRNSEGEITASSEVGAFALQVGDCLAEPTALDSFTDVTGVPCTEPHNAEVIAKFTSSAPDTYTELEITAEASETCAKEMDSYTGPNWGNLDLAWSYFYPDPTTWDAGKHTVVCYAVTYSGDSTLTASVKGAGA
jgi:hypothetical protein